MICADPVLRAADAAMGAAHERPLRGLADMAWREAPARSQKHWLAAGGDTSEHLDQFDEGYRSDAGQAGAVLPEDGTSS